MAIDREATIKNAEKFLRGGRLDAAIAEYARVVEDHPRDWTSANTLGDLYTRAGQSDRAVALYRRIADHLLAEGFYPKAAALLKKILKISPDDEGALIQLAETAVRQGLLADGRAHYLAVADRRRQRGDTAGADEIAVRLGALDPGDLPARLAAARALERAGDTKAAAARYRQLYDEFMEKGRDQEAAAALQDCMRCNPTHPEPDLLLTLAGLALRQGRLDEARGLLREVVTLGAGGRDAVVALAWTLAEDNVDAAVLCVDVAADASVAAGEFTDAAALLQEFAARVPGQIGTLLRLVEVAVDGGLDATMYEAQAQLADAYLAAERPDEARVIAEDLVTREPMETAHAERLRRALEMLNVDDVEAAIAARLTVPSGGLSEVIEDFVMDPPAVTAGPAPAPVSRPTPRAPAPPSPPPSASTEIDLTSLLGELEGPFASAPTPLQTAPARDLEEVFAGMRHQAARQDENDDSDEHMALARTYLEMGLPDEAVSSLEIAVRAPLHRFAAAAALAHIYRDQSDLTRAVEWFERAAEAPAPTADEGYALLYDLGDVLETLGEPARSLAVFLELAADAPDFRDVGARVTRLANSETEG